MATKGKSLGAVTADGFRALMMAGWVIQASRSRVSYTYQHELQVRDSDMARMI